MVRKRLIFAAAILLCVSCGGPAIDGFTIDDADAALRAEMATRQPIELSFEGPEYSEDILTGVSASPYIAEGLRYCGRTVQPDWDLIKSRVVDEGQAFFELVYGGEEGFFEDGFIAAIWYVYPPGLSDEWKFKAIYNRSTRRYSCDDFEEQFRLSNTPTHYLRNTYQEIGGLRLFEFADPVGPNLVNNGSFENGYFGSSGIGYSEPRNSEAIILTDGSDGIDGWTVAGAIEYLNGAAEAYDDNGHLGWYRSVILNADGKDGRIVSMPLEPVPDGLYRLTYRLSGRDDCDDWLAHPENGSGFFGEVEIHGRADTIDFTESIGHFPSVDESMFPSPMKYETNVKHFIAGSDPIQLEFSSNMSLRSLLRGTNCGPIIDLVDVRLTE